MAVPHGEMRGGELWQYGRYCGRPGNEATRVPEQHVPIDMDTMIPSVTLSDLRQFTEEEKADVERPQKAREALAAMKKDKLTLAGLAEEIRLIREIIGA